MDGLKKTVQKCKFSNGFTQTVYKFIDGLFHLHFWTICFKPFENS